MQVNQTKFQFMMPYAKMLGKVQSAERVKRGVDLIVTFKEAVPAPYRGQTDPYFDNALKGIAQQKQTEGKKDLADYINGKLNTEKKGF